MNRLSKYILIECLISLALSFFLIDATKCCETYIYNIIFWIQNTFGSFLSIDTIAMVFFLMYIFFTVFLGALYLFREKEDFLKSLLISLSGALLLYITTVSWIANFVTGDGRVGIGVVTILSLVIMVLSLFVNSIILAILKLTKNKDNI